MKVTCESLTASYEQREMCRRIWRDNPCSHGMPLLGGETISYFCDIKEIVCPYYDTGKSCDIYREFLNKKEGTDGNYATDGRNTKGNCYKG